MDLYADLPLAKGATADAVGADGTSKPSPVWAKGVATQRQAPPPVATSVSMLPSSVAAARAKSPATATAVAAGKPAARGFSLAFRPASLARKAPTAAAAPVRSNAFSHAKPTAEITSAPRGGLGFVAATTWTQVTPTTTTTQTESIEEVPTEAAVGSDAAANTHFFQATYRDEYHPSRPNNYESFCDERAAKKKMDQVKRELEERQRQQERESKREREQFAKDVSEGKAPSIALPTSAGRGRGMTVPAWMRKKIEESAAVAPVPQVVDTVLVGSDETQFDDAAPRGGLGFSSGTRGISPVRDEFGRDISARSDRAPRPHGSAGRDAPSNIHRSRSHSRDRSRHFNSRGADRSAGPTNDPRSSHGKPRPGRVVLLQNMVGPGEVDNELEQEVKDECTTKYGPVENCVVLELHGRGVAAEEAVRIFVQFRQQTHADQALNGLNSRFFGGRRVKATYYDEDRFTRRDLSS